jgi:hypothetical protein
MFENITYSDIVNAPSIQGCDSCKHGYCTAHNILWHDGTRKDLFMCMKSGESYFKCLLDDRKGWEEKC